MDEADIKKLLEEFRINKKVIEQLSKSYDEDTILNVAFKEKMYDIILELFSPISIDNEIKMYFDIFTYLSPIEMQLPIFIERFDLPEIKKEKILKLIFNPDIEKIKQIKVGNTLPREISGYGHLINNINDVIYYAEPACMESMIYLFNNNIRTTMNDTECVDGDNIENGTCSIWIDYDALSEENKEIANQLIVMNTAKYINREQSKTISIEVPCNKNETIGSVSNKLKKIVQDFKKQPILYGFHSRDQIISRMKEEIKDRIYNNMLFPNNIDAYEYCMKLIKDGLVKENSNGNIQIEDGRKFLINDLVEVISKSKDFFNSYIEYYGFYYDPLEEKYWETKKLYERYVDSKKQLGESEYQFSDELSNKRK